jgi:hypothetical protein
MTKTTRPLAQWRPSVECHVFLNMIYIYILMAKTTRFYSCSFSLEKVQNSVAGSNWGWSF